MRLTSKLLG